MHKKVLAGVALLFVAACAPRFRHQSLGSQAVVVGQQEQASSIAVAASSDSVEVKYQLYLPRAVELQYAVRCPGGERSGVLGERWENYEKRRLAELQAQAHRERQATASLVGAVTGHVQGQAQVVEPTHHAQVTVAADGQEIGQAVAEATTPAVQLGPMDTGARTLSDSVTLPGGVAGSCSMAVWSRHSEQDLSGVTASFHVARLVDLQRERREGKAKKRQAALALRAQVTTTLVSAGADPDARRKAATQKAAHRAEIEFAAQQAKRHKREQERADRVARNRYALAIRGRVRAQFKVDPPSPPEPMHVQPKPPKADIRVAVDTRVDTRMQPRPVKPATAELDVGLAVEIQREGEIEFGRRQASLNTRGRIIAWLESCGADKYHRARVRQAKFDAYQADLRSKDQQREEARRREKESITISLRAREELLAYLVANGADPDYRRRQNEADFASFEARVDSRRLAERRKRQAMTAMAEASVTANAPEAEVSVASLTIDTISTNPPPAPVEVRPAAPSANATWISGFYERQGSQWVWISGTWATPPTNDAVWIPGVEVRLGGRVVVRPGSWRDQLGKKLQGHMPRRSVRPNVRDHRSR